MIVGIGIDHVEVRRMEGLLERHPDRARRRLFTAAERDSCDARPAPAECFAARFAAKEAYMKALGTGWSGSVSWREIEVSGGETERPRLRLHGTAAARLRDAGGRATHVSLTHEGGLATAVVVIEGRHPGTDG